MRRRPFTEIGDQVHRKYPGISTTFSFAGSPTLVTQIQQGAPADISPQAGDRSAGREPQAHRVGHRSGQLGDQGGRLRAGRAVREYPVAELRTTQSDAAAKLFVDYVLGADGQKTLESFGFESKTAP